MNEKQVQDDITSARVYFDVSPCLLYVHTRELNYKLNNNNNNNNNNNTIMIILFAKTLNFTIITYKIKG